LKTPNFRIYLEQWNATTHQNFTTPLIHQEMAKWLMESSSHGKRLLRMMAFRGAGKSTIIALYLAWRLSVNPDLRVLLLAADLSLAIKMARNVRRIIEKHPLSYAVNPTNKNKKIDQWAVDRFTVCRNRSSRDPSILAAGILSNITGCRADLIVYDDVEVPNTCNTSLKREDLRNRLRESNFILVPGGTQLYIGTPHSYFSIYADKARHEIGEQEPFLDGYHTLKIPVVDKDGRSNWPEIFTKDHIEKIKKQSGPQQFAAQMMLQPVNILESRLNTEQLIFYNGALDYSESQRRTVLRLEGRKMVSCQAWWDPSFASAKGDDSVLAIVYIDEEGQYYLHHIEYIKLGLNADNHQAEANQQCNIVADLLQKYYVPAVTIESNGIGKLLPGILKQTLAERKIPCAVIEKSSTQAKHIRIIESFDAILAARALSVHENVRKTNFLSEMMEWQPHGHGKDDGLDAVAGALSQEPVRLRYSYNAKRSKWQSGSNTFHADSNFDV
jgi:phage terminase large subunit-like protein